MSRVAGRSVMVPDVGRASSAEPVVRDGMDPADVSVSLRLGPYADLPPAVLAPADPLTRGVTVVICTYQRAASLVRFLDSLVVQVPMPERVIIVDASRSDETERAVRDHDRLALTGSDVLYFRVAGPLRGLTRQRNFALRWVPTDLVAFFDDDVELSPGCCSELERHHRELGDRVVGVAAVLENRPERPGLFWRLRKWLRIVSDLRPGTYSRSGISIPWDFLPHTETGLVEGDWLPGGATMWRTAAAREMHFNEGLEGYGIGEDLDFSLRMRVEGALAVAGRARLSHHQAAGGRPDAYEMGYTRVRNLYDIHRRCLSNRTRADAAHFVYAFCTDALIQFLGLLRGQNRQTRWQFLRGQLRFLVELFRGRHRVGRLH